MLRSSVQEIREETITKEGFNVSVVETGLPQVRMQYRDTDKR